MTSSRAVRLLRSNPLAASVAYAYAATITASSERPGRLRFTAGACPPAASGRVVGPGDVVALTEQVVANLRAAGVPGHA